MIKKILVVFGTRPKAIKMVPLIKLLDINFEVIELKIIENIFNSIPSLRIGFLYSLLDFYININRFFNNLTISLGLLKTQKIS